MEHKSQSQYVCENLRILGTNVVIHAFLARLCKTESLEIKFHKMEIRQNFDKLEFQEEKSQHAANHKTGIQMKYITKHTKHTYQCLEEKSPRERRVWYLLLVLLCLLLGVMFDLVGSALGRTTDAPRGPQRRRSGSY
jgi:hypothetical protein